MCSKKIEKPYAHRIAPLIQSKAQARPQLIMQAGHSTPEQHHAERREDDAPFRKKLYEWSVAIGTIGLLIVNVFLLVSTKRAARAAKSAAETADAALKTSQQQFRNEQRPYMWLQPQMEGLPKGTMAPLALPDLNKQHIPFAIDIRAENGGHSPAIEIQSTEVFMIFDTSENAQRRAREYVPQYRKEGDIVHNVAAILPGGIIIEVSNELIRDLRSDQKRMYILARVQYRDIFSPRLQVPYETAYCSRVIADGMPLHGCEENIGQSWVK